MKKEKLSEEAIAPYFEKLRESFAARPDAFFKSMCEVVQKKKYTEKELADGVDMVLSTVEYNRLSIASLVEVIEFQRPRFV